MEINRRFIYGAGIAAILAAIPFFVFSHRGSQSPDGQNWTLEKAKYLAERALLDPTPENVARLYQAGSAKAAAREVFAAPSAASEQAYESALDALSAKLHQATSTAAGATARRTLYAFELIHNPDDARQKLYYMLENTFSVDTQIDPGDAVDKISDRDVTALDQILYDGAYGSYTDLVGKVQTTYAMQKYLNLVGSSEKDPNENYSRELMQLFLMGQYTPLDTALTTPNYSDADVNALAYLLTGYRRKVVGGENTIYFDPKAHYSGTKLFLGSEISVSDPEKALAYIVSQRRTEISEFLADKMLKYYVSDSPEPQDIVDLAQEIRNEDFKILPTLEWLFSSDIMYRDGYMQAERYKSPVELVASLYTDVYGRGDYSIVPNPTILGDLGFEPMKPGSIFGRPGFNSNILFYSGTILDKWIGDVDRILRDRKMEPETKLALSRFIDGSGATTPRGFIAAFANRIYLGAKLPQKAEDDIVSYLGSSLDIAKAKTFGSVAGALDLLFAQPEFIMTGGNPSSTPLPSTERGSSSTTSSTLVIVRLRGGMDYQELVANTSDPTYAANRKSLDIQGTSTPLGNGYALNNAASALLPLIQSGEASFVTAVGLPGQVRAHDIASNQMETGLSQDGSGIAANLAKRDPAISLVSITNAPPIMYKGSASLEMGASDLSLYPELGKDSLSPTGQLATFEKILRDRLLPAKSALYYSQVSLLNYLAEEDKAAGGKGTPGPKNATQFPFLESLVDKHVGDVFYLYGDGTYDFHATEEPKYDEQIGALTKDMAKFFDDESRKGPITMVVFSEFGRTDKTNGNEGTDHGIGGGMLILSNVLHWPLMVGGMHPSADKNNWTDVVVDERDVWDTIFHSLYGTPIDVLFGRTETIGSYPATISRGQ